MNNDSEYSTPIDLIIRYLAKEANADECLKVEQWRAASNKNIKEFDDVARIWELSAKAKNVSDIEIEAEWKKLDITISKGSRRVINIKRWVQIAASIVILFGLGFLLITQSQKTTITSETAQVQTINLPDGSLVTLNADSKLSYSKDFGKNNREISLKGEAFFSVSKNADLPFIIEAQGASIKVVGTQFNVKAYKQHDEIKVTVIEGIVQLFETNQPLKQTLLIAGETGLYLKRQKTIKKQTHLDTNDISWKTNKINFVNTPLLEVVEVLKNVYYIDIEVSESVKNCAVTVVFDNKDLASILKVLKSTLDLKITKSGNQILIDGEGC